MREMRTIQFPNQEEPYEIVDAYAREQITNTVLCTPQSFTEAQKEQIRANIGITSENLGSGSNVSTTTEVTYTYDGNNNSSEHTWVLNSSGGKAFVKLGDIPNGELNLVGGIINVVNPYNTWINHSITITDEMLNATVDKGGVIIPAITEGLTQIFYQHGSDNSPITVLFICTKPGYYDIAFDGWMEVIWVQAKGIYAFDNRSYGGSKYAESFSCTITTISGGGSASGGTLITNPIEYRGTEIQVFSRGICIGDSITEGVFNHSQGEIVIKKYAYPTILKRITGVDIVNAGVAGLTSKTWYEASLNSNTQYGRWVNCEWVWNVNPQVSSQDTVSTSLDYTNFDFAFIHLGVNDVGMMGNATVAEMINSFEMNINNIISKLKVSNPGIKVFLATIIPCFAISGNTVYNELNDKIRDIANTIDDVYLVDLNTYSECFDGTAYESQHLTAIGHHKMASEIASIISYTMNKQLDEFKTVQFIGTSYTI